MTLVVYRFQMLLDQLRIDLSGGDIAVAHHFLDGMEIRTVFKQMGGKAMAQGVRRNILVDVCLLLIALDDLPEALTAHTVAADVQLGNLK